MVWINRIFTVFCLLSMLIVLVSFVASNAGEVQLGLFGLDVVSLKISSLVVMSFVSGGLACLSVSVLTVTRLQLKNASLQRKIKRRNDELEKLRSSSLKGLTDA